jgi:hypothetical protein
MLDVWQFFREVVVDVILEADITASRSVKEHKPGVSKNNLGGFLCIEKTAPQRMIPVVVFMCAQGMERAPLIDNDGHKREHKAERKSEYRPETA